MDFTGKVVAITGAAGGIGQALTRAFVGMGAKVGALDRVEAVKDFARDLAREGATIEPALADIGDEAAVAKAFAAVVDALGPVDVLVNNAGISRAANLKQTNGESFRKDVEDNLNGAYYCSIAVLPGMQAKGGGAIVNISSVNGLSTFGDPAYSAGKAGMLSLTKSMAMEYGRFGIRVNAICPGTVRTPVWQHRVDREPEILTKLQKWYPLGRVVEPVDVANAVAFLASDMA
ncbi:MAG: SDR family oxidoreductase, partial [Rhizobiales bacterium]|nr:SDR family oxidoreductase [Hyphomicrobiales bacterium]